MRKNVYRILLAATLSVASSAHAALPAMPEISTALPDAVRQPLITKRGPLAERKLSLIAEAEDNKKRCSNIVVGSEQHRTCLEMQKDFNARVEVLRSEFEQLAEEINAAMRRHTIRNIDPMVVDARNVPTGLPKSVEDEIPNTPAGNRVRKGFQAIMAHDWQVALAWFRDASNQEPGDAGLKRLVDLAQFTLQQETRPLPPASKRMPDADDKAQIAATMVAIERLENDRLGKEMEEALLAYCRSGFQQPGGNPVQLPLDSDVEFLLDPNTAPAKPPVSNKDKQPHN